MVDAAHQTTVAKTPYVALLRQHRCCAVWGIGCFQSALSGFSFDGTGGFIGNDNGRSSSTFLVITSAAGSSIDIGAFRAVSKRIGSAVQQLGRQLRSLQRIKLTAINSLRSIIINNQVVILIVF